MVAESVPWKSWPPEPFDAPEAPARSKPAACSAFVLVISAEATVSSEPV